MVIHHEVQPFSSQQYKFAPPDRIRTGQIWFNRPDWLAITCPTSRQ